MKNFKKSIAEFTKKRIEKSLKANANNTTCTVIYQPKAPEALKKFSNKQFE